MPEVAASGGEVLEIPIQPQSFMGFEADIEKVLFFVS